MCSLLQTRRARARVKRERLHGHATFSFHARSGMTTRGSDPAGVMSASSQLGCNSAARNSGAAYQLANAFDSIDGRTFNRPSIAQ
jgi:hypothetical protein